MTSLLERIYARSPVLVQNAMATGFGIQQWARRHRGEYPALFDQLERQQWASADELQRIQDAAVARTVAFAAREVPYYRELFARQRIRPEDVTTAAELTRLPFTDKATVQEHGDRMRPDRLRIRAVRQTTGGTTGRPVQYWVSHHAIQFTYAVYEARFRHWSGTRFGDRMVSINGKPIVPMDQHGPPYWRRNLAFNQLYVSAYHLSDANLPAIADRIAAFEPVVVVAYVSAVHRIARFLNEHGRSGEIRPRAILVSSETLFPWQREDLERAFGCPVFNGYSLGEPVCFVSQCPDGRMHVSPEFGVVELIDDGTGEGHEIVATGLINDAMPLLRYRTSDRATPGDGAPCSCGRALPTIGDITGRSEEMIVTPEGTAVGQAPMSLAFQSVPHLIETQIVQETPAAIDVKLVVSASFTDDDQRFLVAELRKRLGLTLEIRIDRVASIPRTVSGKHRLIVSRLRGRA